MLVQLAAVLSVLAAGPDWKHPIKSTYAEYFDCFWNRVTMTIDKTGVFHHRPFGQEEHTDSVVTYMSADRRCYSARVVGRNTDGTFIFLHTPLTLGGVPEHRDDVLVYRSWSAGVITAVYDGVEFTHALTPWDETPSGPIDPCPSTYDPQTGRPGHTCDMKGAPVIIIPI